MSAFVCSDRHINALARAARESKTAIYTNGKWWEIKSLEDQETIGKILTAENWKSVNARYNKKNNPMGFNIIPDQRIYKPVEILKACNCYVYQACETDTWKNTLACKIITGIKESMIKKIEGYETADWEIQDSDPNPTPPIQEEMSKCLTQSEKINMGMTDILKEIRAKIKTEFPGCKFSVRKDHYNSMTLSLMKADFKVINQEKTENYILDRSKLEDWQFKNNYQYIQDNGIEKYLEHIELNKYHIAEYNATDPAGLHNNIIFTEQGYNLIKRIIEIVEYYNYDNSDAMTDYFDVNFYDHFQLGQWDKPFIQA